MGLVDRHNFAVRVDGPVAVSLVRGGKEQSMTHTSHPDVLIAGLQPGCPRCEEHARKPVITLDVDNILRLLVRREVFTSLDKVALVNLEEALAQGQRLLDILGGSVLRSENQSEATTPKATKVKHEMFIGEGTEHKFYVQ